jgi:hypothetical protein
MELLSQVAIGWYLGKAVLAVDTNDGSSGGIFLYIYICRVGGGGA